MSTVMSDRNLSGLSGTTRKNPSTTGKYREVAIADLLFLKVPLENVLLIWRRHHCRCRAANVYLCSALMAIEHWGFFSVPHLLWNGASVYNSHLWGPVTLTPIAEHLKLWWIWKVKIQCMSTKTYIACQHDVKIKITSIVDRFLTMLIPCEM